MYYFKEFLKAKAIDFLLWSLQKVEGYKNRCLAQRLHLLANDYDPRPANQWEGEDE